MTFIKVNAPSAFGDFTYICLEHIAYFSYSNETTKIKMTNGDTLFIQGDIIKELTKLIKSNEVGKVVNL